MSVLPSVRDLLDAGEEIVRADWRTNADRAPETAGISRATAASSALDRIAQIGLAALAQEQPDRFESVVDTMSALYRETEARQTQADPLPPGDVVGRRRLDLALRLYILGASAVEREQYSVVLPLVLRRPDKASRSLWLRETVTTMARSGQLKNKSLIPLVVSHAQGHPFFFRHFHESGEQLLSAACQFDFLQCLIAFVESGDVMAGYPNFGAYFNERTEPVVESVVTSGPARAALPQVDDRRLAKMIVELDEKTAHQFFDYAGWHARSWRSAAVKHFLADAYKPSD